MGCVEASIVVIEQARVDKLSSSRGEERCWWWHDMVFGEDSSGGHERVKLPDSMKIEDKIQEKMTDEIIEDKASRKSKGVE